MNRTSRLALPFALLLLGLLAAPAPGRPPRWDGLGAVALRPAGKMLVVGGRSRTLYFLDAPTGKEVAKGAGCAGMTGSPAADLVAVRDPAFFVGTRLRLLSASDGTEKGRIEQKERLAAYAFSADGKRLVLLTEAREGAEK